jgi:regulatory protein
MTAPADSAPAIEHTALRLLAQREHSRWELTRKLSGRGFELAAIAPVLAQLEAHDYLNETRLAERYTAERRNKGFGPLRIRAELRDKGVAEELIDAALAPHRETWAECLATLYARRFDDTPPCDRADYGRRARFLEQRGFSPDAIRRVLRWAD